MLPQLHRLAKQKDFDQVFKNGKKSYDNLLGLRVALNSVETIRVGLMVNTKVSRKATERNRIKRQLRASIKPFLAQIKPQYDIVLIALPSIILSDSYGIANSIEKQLKKMRLI